MRKIVIIAHNIRSSHNVGSLLRTADGLGIDCVYLTGYTPYPRAAGDIRIPHIAEKCHKDIHKTALGAENTVKWVYKADVMEVMSNLEKQGYGLAALEQTTSAIELNTYKPDGNVALLLGSEVKGIDNELLERTPIHLYIPMLGKKESFNVVQAAAMALYYLRFQL